MTGQADVAAFFEILRTIALVWAWVGCLLLTPVVAKLKGQEAGSWFVWSLLFGPLALLAVVGLPDRKMHPESK